MHIISLSVSTRAAAISDSWWSTGRSCTGGSIAVPDLLRRSLHQEAAPGRKDQ